MWNIGPTELIIILIVILIIFGPKNLPKIGQALGRGIREFKDASRGLTQFDDDDQSNQHKSAAPKSIQSHEEVKTETSTNASETKNDKI